MLNTHSHVNLGCALYRNSYIEKLFLFCEPKKLDVHMESSVASGKFCGRLRHLKTRYLTYLMI